MRKLIFLLLLLAAGTAVADKWRSEPITVNTNRMVLTLGDEYAQPCRFDGFWTAPSPVAAYTNTVTVTDSSDASITNVTGGIVVS